MIVPSGQGETTGPNHSAVMIQVQECRDCHNHLYISGSKTPLADTVVSNIYSRFNNPDHEISSSSHHITAHSQHVHTPQQNAFHFPLVGHRSRIGHCDSRPVLIQHQGSMP